MRFFLCGPGENLTEFPEGIVSSLASSSQFGAWEFSTSRGLNNKKESLVGSF